MKLERLDHPVGHRTGTLFGVTAQQIFDALGNMETVRDDEAKVAYSWAFLADGKECGIWDYYGSHERHNFSTYGPHDVFISLFGSNYEGGRYDG